MSDVILSGGESDIAKLRKQRDLHFRDGGQVRKELIIAREQLADRDAKLGVAREALRRITTGWNIIEANDLSAIATEALANLANTGKEKR